MLSTLGVVLPIFALIFAGWLMRRLGVLGPQASSELNRFVVYLALPVLLFDIIAHARWTDVWQPGFVMSFGVGMGVVFALTLFMRLRAGLSLADAAIDGLNAGYANTGFVGFPLALAALGHEALAPTMIATLMTVCIIFLAAIVLIEIGVQTQAHPGRLALKVGWSLLRNPLLVAPVLGAVPPTLGWTLPVPVENFLRLLGGAASPCALVALGLFLAAPRKGASPGWGITVLLVGLKLVGQPVVTWGVATGVFGLPPLMTHAAVLMAALPTGTGPFMLAEFYQREADLTSRVVLISTIVSVLTLSAYFVVIL